MNRSIMKPEARVIKINEKLTVGKGESLRFENKHIFLNEDIIFDGNLEFIDCCLHVSIVETGLKGQFVAALRDEESEALDAHFNGEDDETLDLEEFIPKAHITFHNCEILCTVDAVPPTEPLCTVDALPLTKPSKDYNENKRRNSKLFLISDYRGFVLKSVLFDGCRIYDLPRLVELGGGLSEESPSESEIRISGNTYIVNPQLRFIQTYERFVMEDSEVAFTGLDSLTFPLMPSTLDTSVFVGAKYCETDEKVFHFLRCRITSDGSRLPFTIIEGSYPTGSFIVYKRCLFEGDTSLENCTFENLNESIGVCKSVEGCTFQDCINPNISGAQMITKCVFERCKENLADGAELIRDCRIINITVDNTVAMEKYKAEGEHVLFSTTFTSAISVSRGEDEPESRIENSVFDGVHLTNDSWLIGHGYSLKEPSDVAVCIMLCAFKSCTVNTCKKSNRVMPRNDSLGLIGGAHISIKDCSGIELVKPSDSDVPRRR